MHGGATPPGLSPDEQSLLSALKDAADADKRRTRWAEFFKREKINAEVPNTLNIFRGFKGANELEKVVRAWKDDDATHVDVTTYPVASWSFNRESGRKFAESEGVLLNWRTCKFQNVLADQIADDGNFLVGFLGEHEVIAGPGQAKLTLPKDHQVAVYKGKEYTYSQRAELFQALARDGRMP